MATEPERSEAEDLFDAAISAARAEAGRPVSTDLMRRIAADADAFLPRRPARSGWAGLRAAIAALGGWPALGGLATAAVAGVWIGVAFPDAGGGLTFLAGGQDDLGLLLPDYGPGDVEGG